MVYIEDQNVWKAVNFSASLIKKGIRAPIAFSRAAKYYDVDISEIAKYSGKRGASITNKYKS